MNGPSASNPYAWEENRQKSTAPANDEYFFWLSVSKMMHEAIFATGGLLLALLLYLVLTKAKKSMKNYKQMLLVCCLADIQYLIISHFVQLIIKTQQSVELCVMGGMARNFSYNGQVVVMAVYAAAFGITMTSLPVNYYYRFLCAAGTVELAGLASILALYGSKRLRCPRF
uniref:G_PROTEIN_RECEP_F1_2 domain-containing protein n=1 Tax=Bursaphelenchus xylophilus TaxID=6326 RepID=A0A1I7RWY8_BURXY